MKIPPFWAGVNALLRDFVVVFGFDAVEFWNVQFSIFLYLHLPWVFHVAFGWLYEHYIYTCKLYVSYILSPALFDHSIMFDLVVWKLLNTHTRARVHTHTHTHIYIYIYIYIYIDFAFLNLKFTFFLFLFLLIF